MKQIRRMLSWILVLAMVLSMAPNLAFTANAADTAPGEAFQDVNPSAWYMGDVNYVVEKGLMKGISSTKFDPSGKASRAMVATVLYRMSGETVEAAEVFSDVKPTSWYGEAVTWAAKNGIVNGTGNGKFNPSLNITRQDLAVMMHRYASYMGYNLDVSADISGYPDADKVAPYAEKAMRWAVATGLLKGDEKGNLNPRATATRAQLAAILHRFCGLREITVLYTNDVHTYIDGTLSYANIAAMKQEIESTGKPVMLVDAGDHIQGTAFGSMDNGETIIKLMNAANYDLATLGNHEFDYGMARCLNLWNESDFPYVSANFYSIENEALVLDAYKVYRLGEKNVAFVGLTTPESFTKSTPAYFQNEDGEYIYDIFGGEDGKGLYEAAQKAIDAAREEADIVIVLGHLGDDPASQPWTSEELIANTTGIDAFIDGHSHSTVPMREVKNKDGETVILTQTGSYFASIGCMTISEDGEITTKLVTEYEGEDEAVAEIENAWINSVNEELGQVIGAATVTFDNYDENGKRLVRTYETNTGDFAADALYYLFDNMGLDVDVAVMNGGGVRNKAITGELSYLSCKSIHTFGNVACLQTITGQQLLDALEFGARFSPDAECGGFLQVSSNVSYEIHSYIPNTIVTDDKGVWQAGPTGGYRVQNVKINGEPLDLEAEYNLAGYNYTLRDLGDGFAMFDGAVNVLDYVMQDYMVLANYVQSFPVDEATGLPTITAENSPYGDVRGEGRITVVTEKPVV